MPAGLYGYSKSWGSSTSSTAWIFTPKDLKSDDHRARHPLGRIPVLEDGDISIYESGAIAEYILECHKNGGLKPASDDPHFPEISAVVSLL